MVVAVLAMAITFCMSKDVYDPDTESRRCIASIVRSSLCSASPTKASTASLIR